MKDEKEFELIRKNLKVNLLANMTEFGKSKLLSTNELEMEGPATPDPEFRWFTCRPWKTKRELKKLLC